MTALSKPRDRPSKRVAFRRFFGYKACIEADANAHFRILMV